MMSESGTHDTDNTEEALPLKSYQNSTQVDEKNAVQSVDHADKARHFQRLMAVATVLAAVVLIVVLVRIGPMGRSSENAKSTGNGLGFKRTSSFINGVCSPESLGNYHGDSTNGSAICEKECAASMCCDPLGKTATSTCIQDETKECVAYAKCHSILQSHLSNVDDNNNNYYNKSVDPAPLNLEDTCSQEQVTRDRFKCEEACQPASCCYTNDKQHSCQWRLLLCVDYSPCQNLRNDTKIVPAPSNLDEICSEESLATTFGKAACKDMCQRASCCFADGDEGSCLQSDFISCITYAPCGDLVLHPGNTVVPPPPDNLDDICSVDNLLGPSRDGYRNCADECSVAACCEASDDTNCFNEDPFGCMQYSSCELLNLTGGNLTRAPANISDICSWERIKHGGEALKKCAETCKPAHCCIEPGDKNCWNNGNQLACSEYAVCSLLWLKDGTLPDPPQNISKVCNPMDIFVDDDRYAECEALCVHASCCFMQGDENCLEGNIIACARWTFGGCGLVD